MIRFHYFRDKNDHPVACLAFEIHTAPRAEIDPTPIQQATIQFGLSIWNPRDRFDRRRMRQIAEGRCQKSPTRIDVPWNAECGIRDAIDEVVGYLIQYNQDHPFDPISFTHLSLPKRLVKALHLYVQHAADIMDALSKADEKAEEIRAKLDECKGKIYFDDVPNRQEIESFDSRF